MTKAAGATTTCRDTAMDTDPTPTALGCSVSGTDRWDYQHSENGVTPPNSGPESGEEQPSAAPLTVSLPGSW